MLWAVDSIERRLRAYYEAEADARLRPHQDDRRRSNCAEFARCLVDAGCHRVLDVGSGPACDHKPFASVGVEYVGIDLAVGNAALAAAFDQTVIPASLFRMPFVSEAFPAGWSMSTLQHVPDERIDEALTEMVRVLAPGAPLMIGLWGGRDETIEPPSSSAGVELPRHFTLRSHDRIRTILGRHLLMEWDDTFAAGTFGWEYHVSSTRTPKRGSADE